MKILPRTVLLLCALLSLPALAAPKPSAQDIMAICQSQPEKSGFCLGYVTAIRDTLKQQMKTSGRTDWCFDRSYRQLGKAVVEDIVANPNAAPMLLDAVTESLQRLYPCQPQ
ncbi:Rap1a/Tai family immunity protein [Motiliproteus sp.]|uniref:Rap1a/Tai family immunity protein n=1 Tax=Motiliproteus sp. TaxID=1898955 RepID=UPI003BAC6862